MCIRDSTHTVLSLKKYNNILYISNYGVQSVSRLSKLYGSVDEVDLFAGAVAEKHAPGAMLGPTFVCLIGDQFARFRRGDRFFYEESGQPSSFSESKIK